MKIYITKGSERDDSAYLAEILHANGLSYTHCLNLEEIIERAQPHRDLILLPPGSGTFGIESFLNAGGSVVAILPDAPLEQLAALVRKGEDRGPWSLRFAKPACRGSRGESLWTLGYLNVYEPLPGPDVVAYLSKNGDPESDTVGIISSQVGEGRLFLYAYDITQCITLLRQGDPGRANFLPTGQRTPRAVFLQYPDAPSDTNWRPTADLHAFGLCEIIRGELSRFGPTPILWHLPDGAASILVFSGDEDNSEQSANDEEMRALESVGGAMSLYVIPDLTSINRSLIEEYTRRGHVISVHPNLVPTAGESPEFQVAEAEKQVRLFRETFQWPVRTVRNHFYMWPGYLELPELWARLGIGMDANGCATDHFKGVNYGPFLNVHAAIPLPFVRQDGTLVDVYQQPTHLNDDLQTHPTKFYSLKYSIEQFEIIIQRIFEDAMSFFYTPVCVNVHPVNHASFAGPYSRMLMSKARDLGLPIWSLDRWHDFWRARAPIVISDYAWDGESLSFSLTGTSCESVWLTLPAVFDNRKIENLSVGDTQIQFYPVCRQGGPTVQFNVPRSAQKTTFVATY